MRRTLAVGAIVGWLSLVCLMLWGIRHFASGDGAAILGLLGLMLLMVPLGYRWCELVILGQRSYESEADARAEAAVLLAKLYWLLLILVLGVSGLWIGTTARSPLLVAAAFMLVAVGGGAVVQRLTPQPPDDPLRGPWEVEHLLRSSALLFAATVAGMGLRALFGW